MSEVKTKGRLRIFEIVNSSQIELPVIGNIVCGFPSPAADFLDTAVDLNKYLIKNPTATYFAIADGLSMVDAGIGDKDILIIDRSVKPSDNKIAACVINGEFVLKRLKVDKKGIWLVPANPSFKPTLITEYENFEIWGVLIYSIQRH